MRLAGRREAVKRLRVVLRVRARVAARRRGFLGVVLNGGSGYVKQRSVISNWEHLTSMACPVEFSGYSRGISNRVLRRDGSHEQCKTVCTGLNRLSSVGTPTTLEWTPLAGLEPQKAEIDEVPIALRIHGLPPKSSQIAALNTQTSRKRCCALRCRGRTRRTGANYLALPRCQKKNAVSPVQRFSFPTKENF